MPGREPTERSEHRGRRRRPPRRAAPRRAAAAALVAATAVLAGCLGPTEFDPTGTAPIGSLDAVMASGSTIRVIGWALDPDTAAPITIGVSSRQVVGSHIADRSRPDVAAVHPRHGDRHGFDVRTQSLPPGVNQVCVWAENVARGNRDRLLGCADVRTGTDDPVGALDGVRQIGDERVRVSGWAYDPDAGGPIDVAVTVDGSPVATRRADRPRSDVAARFRSDGRSGYVVDLDARVGSRKVCVRAVDRGRGSDRSLGCRTLHVDSVPFTGVGGGISSLQGVGPAPGHPLERIDRDAGASTTLRDGSVLWFFGDSFEVRDGSLAYFVNNTAAWGPPGSPAVTRDGVASGARPFSFSLPVSAFPGGCPSGWSPVMWPMSAVDVPVAGSATRDRVIVFLANICLNGTSAQSRGVAVAEWTYDAAAPPDGARVTGTVLNQSLFPVETEYGTASLVRDGLVHAYQCGRPDDTRPPDQIVWPDDPVFDGCTVARAAPEDVDDPSAWTYWAGDDGWTPVAEDAEKMVLPGLPTDRQLPVAAFSVVEDPHHGFVMVYSPWPGFTDRLFVRYGDSVTGPWSAPETVDLPGCVEWVAGEGRFCYAGTAQPWRSTPTELGVGWYDQFRHTDPARGRYVAGAVPQVP